MRVFAALALLLARKKPRLIATIVHQLFMECVHRQLHHLRSIHRYSGNESRATLEMYLVSGKKARQQLVMQAETSKNCVLAAVRQG